MAVGIVNYTFDICRQCFCEGYYSADFFCDTFPITANNKVKKGIKGYNSNFLLIKYHLQWYLKQIANPLLLQ